jgi:hypothetical protein
MIKKLHIILGLGLCMMLLAGAMMTQAADNNQGQGGNEDCPDGTTQVAKFNFTNGNYVLEGVNTGGVVISDDADADGGSWTSTVLISAIVVKGGPNAVTEPVNPPAMSGTFSNANLPLVGGGPSGGNIPDISNIKFCAPQANSSVTVYKQVGVNFNFFDKSEDAVFDFIYSDGDTQEGFQLSDNGIDNSPEIFNQTGLPAGTYSIEETTQPANWSFVFAYCSTSNNPILSLNPLTWIPFSLNGSKITFDLAAGQNVYCFFLNNFTPPEDPASLTIIKEVVYEADLDTDSDTNFGVWIKKGLADFDNFSLDDPLVEDNDGVSDTKTYSDIDLGEYTVRESVNAGWIQEVECVGDDDVVYPVTPDTDATINIEAGENITCTFTNTRVTHELNIVKEIEGDPLGSNWQFSVIEHFESLALNPAPEIPGIGGSAGPYVLPVEAYDVGETVPAGYALKRIDCGDGGLSVEFPSSDDFFIILDQDLTCTFTNVQRGDITIVKQTVPDGSDQEFDFLDFVGILFTLKDDESKTFTGFLPSPGKGDGFYTFSEDTLPDGWELTDITCESDGDSEFDPLNDGTGVTVTLAPGNIAPPATPPHRLLASVIISGVTPKF